MTAAPLTEAGSTLLAGLATLAAGDPDGAMRAAAAARMECPDAFTARYADGLAYAAVEHKHPRADRPPTMHRAEAAVRRALIALGVVSQ